MKTRKDIKPYKRQSIKQFKKTGRFTMPQQPNKRRRRKTRKTKFA